MRRYRRRRVGSEENLRLALEACDRAERAADILYGPEDEDVAAAEVLGQTLHGLAESGVGSREELIARAEAVGEMLSFRGHFRRLRNEFRQPPGDEEVLAERLSRLEQEAQEREQRFAWAAGHLWVLAGKEAMAASRPDAAARYFASAVRCFRDYPAELRRRAARARRALALVQQRAYETAEGRPASVSDQELQDAIRDAEQAVMVEPLSAFERQVLGDMYETLGNLEQARAAWTDALLWKPSDADMHWKLGFCYWRLAEEATEKSARDTCLTRAEEFLSRALRLYRDDRYDERRRTSYWLAKIAARHDDFQALAEHLRILLESERTRPIADLLLAEGYLRQQRYAEAEAGFRRVLDDVARLGARPWVVLGEEINEAWSIPLLHVRAACGLARSLTDREASWREAERALADAAHALSRAEPGETTRPAEAALYACRGKVLRRRGRYKAAIDMLQKSITLVADPEAYVELALTCIAQAGTQTETAKAAVLLENAQRYRDLARATDTRNLYKVPLAQLDAKLDARLQNGASPSRVETAAPIDVSHGREPRV